MIHDDEAGREGEEGETENDVKQLLSTRSAGNKVDDAVFCFFFYPQSVTETTRLIGVPTVPVVSDSSQVANVIHVANDVFVRMLLTVAELESVLKAFFTTSNCAHCQQHIYSVFLCSFMFFSL